MAKALAAGIAAANSQATFLISDPNTDARNSFSSRVGAAKTLDASSNQEVLEQCQTVFLAVKPQYVTAALEEIHLDSRIRPLIVSVVAGVPISRITALTGIDRVIRVMPNTPCLIGQGACGVSVPAGAADRDFELVKSYLEPIGLVVVVPEPLLDSVTGLSGSGPAFVFAFMESLIAGAVQTGMPPDIAQELAIQTVFGAAGLVKETGESISTLRERVTSPAGTTLAGLNALKEHGFQEAVVSAVVAATERSRELGQG
jgi:pyrroline-5-carboxylate reductase